MEAGLKLYNLYVGTVRGALIYTQCGPDEKLHFELEQHEKAEITSFTWNLENEDEIIIGYKTGVVQFYDKSNNTYTKTIDNLEGKGGVTGVGVTNKSYIYVRHNGTVNIHPHVSKKAASTFSLNLASDESTVECCVQQESNLNRLGFGGEKNDFKIWDLESKTAFFKAKSLGHDSLNLPIPTSVRAISFFKEQDSLAGCACKEGRVLLYDCRAQRRPIINFNEPKASYTSIATTFNDRQCVAGTTKGYIQLLDLRQPKNCLVKTYKSFTGSVTSIVCVPNMPVVISSSLDRYLRIHNLQTKQCIYEKYMKQSLVKVLYKSPLKLEKEEKPSEVVTTEVDDIFDNMKEVVEEGDTGDEEEETPRKKRKIPKQKPNQKKKKNS